VARTLRPAVEYDALPTVWSRAWSVLGLLVLLVLVGLLAALAVGGLLALAGGAVEASLD